MARSKSRPPSGEPQPVAQREAASDQDPTRSTPGADRVLFGTCYPHRVHDMKGSTANTAAPPADVCHAIREGNAREILMI